MTQEIAQGETLRAGLLTNDANRKLKLGPPTAYIESADASGGHMGKANDDKDHGGASNRAPNLMAPEPGEV